MGDLNSIGTPDSALTPGSTSQTVIAMADRRGVFHGVAGHDDSEYGSAHDRSSVERGAFEHEVGAGQLYVEPGVFIPISGWMADRFGTRRVFASAIGLFTLGSFLCGISTNIHVLVACRILQGCGGAMMVPVGPTDHGSYVCEVRINTRDELCGHPWADRTDAWANRRWIESSATSTGG